MCTISPETVCVAAVACVMISAAISDIRSREVSDLHWAAICLIGTSMCMFRFESIYSVVVGFAGCSLLAVHMLSERVVGSKAVAVISLSGLCSLTLYLMGEGPWVLVTPTMYSVFLSMYVLGIIRGGADAKALMSMSIASPFYTGSEILWHSSGIQGLLFNPPFMVLFVALSVSLFSTICVLYRSVGSGNPSLTRYRMSLDEAERSFVWPMEDYVDGKVVRVDGIPPENAPVYDRLRMNGVRDVEVTPMVPFVLPLAVSYIIVMVLGDPMVLFLGQ